MFSKTLPLPYFLNQYHVLGVTSLHWYSGLRVNCVCQSFFKTDNANCQIILETLWAKTFYGQQLPSGARWAGLSLSNSLWQHSSQAQSMPYLPTMCEVNLWTNKVTIIIFVALTVIWLKVLGRLRPGVLLAQAVSIGLTSMNIRRQPKFSKACSCTYIQTVLR